MPRIILLLLLISLLKPAYTQQVYSDHGNPIVDPKPPCNCTEWRNEKMRTDSIIRFQKIVRRFTEKGINYVEIYYRGELKTTMYDICEKPANCKGVIRTTTRTFPLEWRDTVPDCGVLKPGEVCCGNTPAPIERCCNQKVIRVNQVCCMNNTYPWRPLPFNALSPEWQGYLKSINERATNLIKTTSIPIKIFPPVFSIDQKVRSCCKDVTVTEDGEREITVQASFRAQANRINFVIPSFTRLKPIILKFHTLQLVIEADLGLFATLDATVVTKVTDNINQCTSKNCMKLLVELNIPVELELAAVFQARIETITEQRCKHRDAGWLQCPKMTKHPCGYCPDHGNPFLCLPPLTFKPITGKAQSNLTGRLDIQCGKTVDTKLKLEKTTFLMEIPILKKIFNILFDGWDYITNK